MKYFIKTSKKKEYKLKFYIIALILEFLCVQTYLAQNLRCGTSNLKIQPIPLARQPTNQLRKSQSSEYKPIRIFIDKTHIENQAIQNPTYKALYDKINGLFDEVNDWFKNILSVLPYNDIIISDPNFFGLSGVSEKILNKAGEADTVIFPIITDALPRGNYAMGGRISFDPNSKRPTIGVLYINSTLDLNMQNLEPFLKNVIFHEITHVLVFQKQHIDLFKYPTPLIYKTIGQNSITLLATPKVVEKAKIHFKCDTLEGVELENEGGEGSQLSHWESRIMLGDYMIAYSYDENTISEITLALFEDSGWYKVNYYTGGLFRFGKGRGCDFLNKKCIENEKTQFPNEYCYKQLEQRCTTGRLSRGACYLFQIGDLPSDYRYFPSLGDNYSGHPMAEYCPITYDYLNDGTKYYSGNCKYASSSNSLGEKFGDNSLCVISSLITPGSGQTPSNKAICHEVECDHKNKNVIIKINDKTILCPKEGGELTNQSGYEGSIQCPDFYSVCTSNVFCNDIESCIKKKATPLLECQNGYFVNLAGNVCVNKCEEGAIFNEKIDKCVCDSTHPLLRYDKSKCVSSPSECESGTFANLAMTECVNTCESNSEHKQGSLQCTCDSTHPLLRYDKSKCVSSPSECDPDYVADLLGTHCIPKDYCGTNTEVNVASNKCSCLTSAPFISSNGTGCLASSLECQIGEYANATNIICSPCQNSLADIMHSSCVEQCGLNTISQSNQCLCQNNNFFIDPINLICTTQCPKDNIVKNNICTLCQYGTYAEANECKPCGINGCLRCEKNIAINQIYCNNCQNGFFLENSTCINCMTGCINCNSSEICLDCGQEYDLKDNKCISKKELINIIFNSNDKGKWNLDNFYYKISKNFISKNEIEKEEVFSLKTNDEKNPLMCKISNTSTTKNNIIECYILLSPSTYLSNNNVLKITEGKEINKEKIIYNITADKNFSIDVDKDFLKNLNKSENDFLMTQQDTTDFEKSNKTIPLHIYSLSNFSRNNPSNPQELRYVLLSLINNAKIPQNHSFSLLLTSVSRRRHLQQSTISSSTCTLDQVIPIQMLNKTTYAYYNCNAITPANKLIFSGLNDNKAELLGKDETRNDLIINEGNLTFDDLKANLFDKINRLNKISLYPSTVKKDNDITNKIIFATRKDKGKSCPPSLSLNYFECNLSGLSEGCSYSCFSNQDPRLFGYNDVLKSELDQNKNIFFESTPITWDKIETIDNGSINPVTPPSDNGNSSSTGPVYFITPPKKKGLSKGAIAAIAIVCSVVVLGLIILLILMCRKNKLSSEETEKINSSNTQNSKINKLSHTNLNVNL